MLPAPLPSTCSMGLFDRFPFCLTREFIKFSICSTKAGTLPSCATFAASNPESKDYIYLTPHFLWHSSTKSSPTGRAKKWFGGLSSGIHHNIQKAQILVNVRVYQEIIVFPN